MRLFLLTAVVMVAFAVAAMAILVGILMTSERAMLLRERQDSVRQAPLAGSRWRA